MSADINEKYGSKVSYSQYLGGRRKLVPPRELVDEFYLIREIVPVQMRTRQRFALDTLVSIENIEDKGDFCSISYELAYADAIKESDTTGLERVASVQVDGIMFVSSWARRGFFRRKKETRAEVGYFLSADDEWNRVLPEDSTERPRDLALT